MVLRDLERLTTLIRTGEICLGDQLETELAKSGTME